MSLGPSRGESIIQISFSSTPKSRSIMRHRTQSFSPPTTPASTRTRAAPLASLQQHARVCVNVLPVNEDERGRTLGQVVAMDIDPNTTIFDFKNKLEDVFRHADGHDCCSSVYVPSLFITRQRFTDAMDAEAVSNVVMRRENYLRVNGSVSSCLGVTPSTSNSDRVHVVALVIPPSIGFRMSSLVPSQVQTIESFLHSDIVDKTLPPTETCWTSPLFIRDDYVRMYRAIRELHGLSNQNRKALTPNLSPKPASQLNGGVAVTGSPGVGKSEFVWFLLQQLSQTHTVVLDIPGLFLLVRPDGTLIERDCDQSLPYEWQRHDIIYLVDTKEKLDFPVDAKVIDVTAPNRQSLKRLNDLRRRVSILYMPVWSLSELMECHRRRCLDGLTEDEAVTLYDHYGGSFGDIACVNRYDTVEDGIGRLQSRIGQLAKALGTSKTTVWVWLSWWRRNHTNSDLPTPGDPVTTTPPFSWISSGFDTDSGAIACSFGPRRLWRSRIASHISKKTSRMKMGALAVSVGAVCLVLNRG